MTPLAAIFADIRAHPQANYWIFGMLFSTLLPTVAHGAIVSFSAGSLLAPKWRAKLYAGISSEDTVEQAATMLGIGLYASFSLLAPLGFLWVLYWLFAQAAPYPFLHYLNALEGFAAALN